MAGDSEISSSEGLIWNFDAAESQLIFNLRLEFIMRHGEWKLEDSYWALRKLINECVMFCIDSEKTSIKSEQEKLDNIRSEFIINTAATYEDRTNYYISQEELYNLINSLIKKHKLCFREERMAGRI